MEQLKLGFFNRQLYIFLTIVFILFNIAAFAQEYQTTKALKGEGIYSLLKRHGLSPGEHLNTFIELNKSNLGSNNSLYSGRTYKLPIVESSKTAASSSGGTTYSIFGKKYEQVSPIDNQLSGAVFYLVSGHGGPDPGAVGKLNNHILCEDEYAYDVTLRLARKLIEHGALVYMITRDDNDGIRDDSYLQPDKDEKCYPNLTIPRNQLSRLRQRKDAVNKLYIQNKGKHQRLIITHVDSRSKGENIDVFFYYDKRSKTGKKMAVNMQSTFKAKYDKYQPNRGYHGSISARNLYVLKYSYPPAVFIELGNINHTRDQQRFIKENNRQALANWMAEAMIKDYKNNR
ncbi:N-acetylmuramoyl-L-alanine amidase family protein [Sunxiuqinia sp. A32]|uniref:N-acetylmuramoyl-L-alanine amidase family protein n=1 Tax=Sunxiuqinia sp. A32 TaxID=3461496 RepID=UPI004045C17F